MIQVPRSTYRLQFNRSFTFAQAAEVVPYLAELGISHCYASPYLRARPGSMHGYDIIDHHHLNPEIGTPEDYDRFIRALRQHGMGQILDIVPNHMGVMGSDNAWWLDVLENGEASSYADFFDIDWEPLKDELQGKVLVAVLADQYGTVLERGDLKLAFDAEQGEFSIWYFQHKFPVNPCEYPRILAPAAEQIRQQAAPDNQNLLELESMISAFSHLPRRQDAGPEKRAERVRDKEIHKRRLALLCGRAHEVAGNIAGVVEWMNGSPSDPTSFEPLHELIKAQAFRLAHWRVAADDINYRRFFDVNDLAALRQECEAVFLATHEFVLQLLAEGKVNGLRIDHPDGLYNPKQYFERLQRENEPGEDGRKHAAARSYVIAEKILTGSEQLPPDWPIQGTTGYEFANLVNGLFVDPQGEAPLTRIYEEFTGERSDFRKLVYDCKKLVMDRSLNSELNVLANHLSRIALSDRHTCDFTLKSLRDALAEIVACFPVYRTYVSEQQVSESDCRYIREAVECAKSVSGAADLSVFDFIRDILLTQQAEGHPPYYQRSVIHFAMRFQQYTSAVMAKGLEDTGLYRYNRLVSLNDVGGDPLRFGVAPEEFNAATLSRAASWPHSMLAGSTHDSKRSEDVRARINVISELPDEWREHVLRWRDLNGRHKSTAGIPSANDEYLFYQTLAGCWPMAQDPARLPESFVQRVCDYMLKAVREAKQHTSWANQNELYESGTVKFVRNVLSSAEFRQQFAAFQRKLEHFGMLTSLSQTLLKLAAPGVPDTYQGNELWEFNLVDPDNRRTVDYGTRRQMLSQIKAAAQSNLENFSHGLAQDMRDGCIKMYVLWKALQLRVQLAEVFSNGVYSPLQASGQHAKHVVAFSRVLDGSMVIVAVPRLCARLLQGVPQLPVGSRVWDDTTLIVPCGRELRNVLTGERVCGEKDDGHQVIPATALFNYFPVALLTNAA